MDFFSTCETSDPSTFTAWENLSANEQKKYTFDDECKPYGKVKVSAKSAWVFVATRKRLGAGTLMLLK